MGKGDDWTDDELQECLVAYLRMYQDEVLGRKFVKVEVYRALSKQTGRSVKSIERRFCNISYIMNLRGRKWITGLLPLSNVGPNVQPRLEAMLDRLEGKSHLA
jgi:hypothetical protein